MARAAKAKPMASSSPKTPKMRSLIVISCIGGEMKGRRPDEQERLREYRPREEAADYLMMPISREICWIWETESITKAWKSAP